MKRLNEYTLHELECLQLMLSLAGFGKKIDEDGYTRDMEIHKFWAAEIDQAIKDRKLEDTLLPFPYKPSEN